MLEEHIIKMFTYPQDIVSICKKFEVIALQQPPNLRKEEYKDDMGKRMMWETQMKTFMKRSDMRVTNTRGIYTIVWRQCSPMMQPKLESVEDFDTKSNACNCIWLVKEIQGITHHF